MEKIPLFVGARGRSSKAYGSSKVAASPSIAQTTAMEKNAAIVHGKVNGGTQARLTQVVLLKKGSGSDE